MKKSVKIFIVLAFALIVSVGCEKKIEKISFVRDSMSLNIGATKQIKISNNGGYKLTFRSLDETVATVDNTGKITGVKEGTTKVTAMSKEGSQKISIIIRVKAVEKKVTKILLGGQAEDSIETLTVSLFEKKTAQISAVVLPEDANNKAIAWKSRNQKVATVDDNGKVTAIKEGEATIVATAKDGSGKYGKILIKVSELDD